MTEKLSEQQPRLGAKLPVVHVGKNSETDLEALFSVLDNKDANQNNSFRSRNMPASFFKPPEPRHSRDNSLDSSPFQGNHTRPISGLAANTAGLNISHSRSRSSPAQLPHAMMSAAPTALPMHLKQQSIAGEFTDEMGNSTTSNSQNWKNSNDQLYFMNSISDNNQSNGSSSNWQSDPRAKSTSTSALSQAASLQPLSSVPVSTSLTDINQQLPTGWEQSLTSDGEIYFINHIDKCTSWYDPRQPKHLQGPGPVKLGQGVNTELQRVQAERARLSREQEELNRREVALKTSSSPRAASNLTAANIAANTAAIHNTATTTPSLHHHHHLLHNNNNNLPLGNNMQSASFQQMRNHSQSQESFTSSSFQDLLHPASNNTSADFTNDSQMNGVDPFLGQGQVMAAAAASSLDHTRQNSADSGLGMLANSCYSLPRTPEGYLGTTVENDSLGSVISAGCSSGLLQEKQMGNSSLSAGHSSLNGMGMDIDGMGGVGRTVSGAEAMDTEELLQNALGTDLLSDSEIQKIDSLLTWL